MTGAEIAATRRALGMTQEQLAQLLGVHSLTVSKWERGLLRPTAHQEALLRAFHNATDRSPDIGGMVVGLLVGAGVGLALFHLLRAAFDGPPTTPPTPPPRRPRSR